MQRQDQEFIQSKLADLGVMDKLAGKRILVTGGTGFVGRWLGVDGLEIYRVPKSGYEMSLQLDWDYIIHAAPVDPIAPLRCADKFMMVSSGAVYDKQISEFSIEKSFYETLSGGFSTIARLFTIAGYGARSGRFALDTWIRQGMAGQPLTVYNYGMSKRSYIYGADMAVWLLTILAHGEGVYDVGGIKSVQVSEVANYIATHFGVSWEYIDGPEDPRPRYAPAQPMRATELGLQIWTPWREAIDKTIKEYEEYEN